MYMVYLMIYQLFNEFQKKKKLMIQVFWFFFLKNL